jgi:GT2 family glycosyltransferase
VIDQIGLFDPRFFLYYEEVDHCRRAREAGWKVFFYPDTEVIHIGGESAKADSALSGAGRQISRLQIESELLYFRKYYGFAGILASVLLTSFGLLLITLKDLPLGLNRKRGNSGNEGLMTIFSILAATRFASRATK